MGVGAGLYMYDVVVKTFTFVISSTDEFSSFTNGASNVPFNFVVCSVHTKHSTNKPIQDSRLRPRAQRTVLHSQTPLCTAKLTADGCQSVGANANRAELKRWSSTPLCVVCRWLTSLDLKCRRTPHMPCYVKTWRHIHKRKYICVAIVVRVEPSHGHR